MRLALSNEKLDDIRAVTGSPGGKCFWLIEELISFKGLDLFLDIIQHGHEIMWKSDDVFPFVLFYALLPFMIVKKSLF